MKIQRGEICGFVVCLGYDYDFITKTISVNKEETEIVKYIFKRYIKGYGCRDTCHELKIKEYRIRPVGKDVWKQQSQVSYVTKNMFVTYYKVNPSPLILYPKSD